ALDRLEQARRRWLLEEVDRCARPHRENDTLAKPKREGQRGARREQVLRGRLQHVARERVRDRENVAMKVHRRLRLSCGARRECEHAYVVGGGRDVFELGAIFRGDLRQVVLVRAAIGQDLEPVGGGRLQIFVYAVV